MVGKHRLACHLGALLLLLLWRHRATRRRRLVGALEAAHLLLRLLLLLENRLLLLLWTLMRLTRSNGSSHRIIASRSGCTNALTLAGCARRMHALSWRADDSSWRQHHLSILHALDRSLRSSCNSIGRHTLRTLRSLSLSSLTLKSSLLH